MFGTNATFLNRDTESVVVLAPNIKLVVGRRLSVVGCGSYRIRLRARAPAPHHTKNLVELTGIEPVTPWLQTRCSPS